MLQRLPKPQAILQVYAVIVVLLAGWTITAFLWKLSAWLLLLNLGELLTLFAYAMLTNLLESLFILLLLLVFTLLLPPRFLRDPFIVRGTIFSIGLIGAMIAFVGLHMLFGTELGSNVFLGPVAILLLTTTLLSLSLESRLVRGIHSAILRITDRLLIFLFILLPLFVISSIYLIVRNLV